MFREEPILCNICKMWLNGPEQFFDHEPGHKHEKNVDKLNRKPSRAGRRSGNVDELKLSVHPYIVEDLVTSTSQATARVEDVRAHLPVTSEASASRDLRRWDKTQQKRRHMRSSFAGRLAPLRIPDEVLESEDRHCAWCGQECRKRKWCSGCYAVFYCSRDCQRADWRQHKSLCESLFGLLEIGTNGTVPTSTSSAFTSLALGASSITVVSAAKETECSESDWTLVSESESEHECIPEDEDT